MRRLPVPFLVTAMALGLSACSGSEAAEDTRVDPNAPTVELSAIQKGSFERLNRDEVKSKYTEIVKAMDPAKPTPPSAEIEFGWLDQDDDSKLSVAEFALWKFTPEAGSDAALTDEQLTDVASNFFANDVDGDQLLSEAEFATAAGKPAPAEEKDGEVNEG